ncbi:hypothetical protein JCM33374_g5149 [Metschnikowia sp. JCM 33374]|nr:hypothetical protein JCM33374_g5149 [Metschnikowia sp. JCM 33374]
MATHTIDNQNVCIFKKPTSTWRRGMVLLWCFFLCSYANAQILLPTYRGRLLEGITYNAANNSLLWVDIISAEVHRVSLEDDSKLAETHETLKFAQPGESVGAVLLTKDPDTVLVCAKYGVARANFATQEFSYLLKYPLSPESASKLRSNDGIIDPWGNLWIGLMNDFPTVKAQGKVEPDGLLYRISATDLSVKVMVEDALIPNGLAFSKDASTADGHIFQAVFGQSAVLKYDLNGQPEQKFIIPAERVTCTGLGGKNDDEMFITTGHQQLDDFSAEIDAFDHTGDLGGFLFRVKLDKKINSMPTGVWGGPV